jgi:outer membrane lipoprotein-sorting protein
LVGEKAILRQLDLGVESTPMLNRKVALRITLLILSGVLPLLSYADQPSVDEILKKVSETYQNLQSYQFVARKTTEVSSVGSIEPAGGGRVQSNFHKSTSSDIILAGVNPGKFRLEVMDEDGALLSVSDGQTKWTYMSKRKQYTEEPVTGGASNQSESGGNAQLNILRSYRSLLVERFRGLSQYSSTAVLEKDNQLKIGANKVACYVVKIQTQQGVNELWIDKDRYIVWKSKHVGPSASEGISLRLLSQSTYRMQN